MIETKKENNRITVILTVLCLLFISIVIYLSYFKLFTAEGIKYHQANRRVWAGEEKILRGEIKDRRGVVLVNSERDSEGNQSRKYNYGDIYGNLIGYTDKAYGRSGIEDKYNGELLNLKDKNPIEELQELLKNNSEKYGNNLNLTIDNELQKKAYELLGSKKGSIVLTDVETGEIYAMASTPSFDPSKLKDTWTDIVENKESPLLNRAINGLYPPGSIFKVITSAGIIESLNPDEELTTGKYTTIDGFKLKNYDEVDYGSQDLENAFIKSSNTYFATQGLELGEDGLKDLASRFYFNKEIDFDLDMKTSKFTEEAMGKSEIGSTAIGQGKTLVTPLNMAMMSAGIGNNGSIVKPILVKSVTNQKGKTKELSKVEELSKAIEPSIAEEIKQNMVKVVEKGTGQGAKISGLDFAGKTGTAESSEDSSNAWFVGFAPANNPKFSVAVLLEDDDETGGKSAAPLAKSIMENALEMYD